MLLIKAALMGKICSRRTCKVIARNYQQHTEPKKVNNLEQIEFIKGMARSTRSLANWPEIKTKILSMKGDVNNKNVTAVMLKLLLSHENLSAAKSVIRQLRSSKEELSIGTINCIMRVYYELGKESELTTEEIKFIKDACKSLHERYKILDSQTCESLILGLYVIGDWRSCIKFLDDIRVSSVPSRASYSHTIAALFDSNKEDLAMDVMKQCLNDQRPFSDVLYKSWINHILRTSQSDSGKALNLLEDMNKVISENCLRISKDVANLLEPVYTNTLKWKATHAEVSETGKCHSCKSVLQKITLSLEEYSLLHNSFKDQVLVGKDIFLKTSPEELTKFVRYIEKTAPYDIVLDALNISLGFLGNRQERTNFLISVVQYFLEKNMKVLVVGRDHMREKLRKRDLEFFTRHTCSFFTKDLSQDDPFFVTAAIFSGAKTDILTRDKLRGHRSLLADEKLRSLFLRWQWQHQWTYEIRRNGTPKVVKPLKFTPCAQKGAGWHIPYELEQSVNYEDPMNAESPIPPHWLCLQPSVK